MTGFVGPDEPIDTGAFVGPDAPVLPAPIHTNNITGTGFPEPQNAGNDALGNSVPFEQRLANNIVTAGSGVGMGSGVGDLATAGVNLIKGTPEAATGITNTAAQYAKRFGQNQAIKALGGTRGQITGLGIPESRELAQTALDKGIISPTRGPIGLEETVENMSNKAGSNIGAARKAADAKAQAPSMAEILQNVKNQLEEKYSSGVNKGMAGLNRAREEIARGGTGTFTGNAQKATDLNASAAANKIYRPQDAATDTADIISQLNNTGIQKAMNPADFAKYQQSLKDYGDLNKIKQFITKGEGREMAGRGGGSLTKTIYDKTMDSLGNRISAVAGNRLGQGLQNVAPFEKPGTKSLASYLLQKQEEETQ